MKPAPLAILSLLLLFGLSARLGASETGSYANPADANIFPLDFGVITLKMKPDADPKGTSYFRYVDNTGVEQWLQKFSGNKRCNYSSSTSQVALSGTGGTVGYLESTVSYGLGVNNKEASSSCSDINPSEFLNLDFRAGLGGKYLDYAELDMELKYRPNLVISLYRDDTLVYTYQLNCTASDCGPDSADNKRIRVPMGTGLVFFNRMVLTVQNAGTNGASATLEGGANAGTQPSLFHVAIAGQPLECGLTYTATNGGTVGQALFFPDPGQTCPSGKTLAFIVEPTGKNIKLLVSGSTEQLNALVTAYWTPEPMQDPVKATTVFPPAGGEAEVWCNGTEAAPLLPAGHAWCRITRTVTIAGTGFMQLTETSLLRGDSELSRN